MSKNYIFTSESVSRGHPDKIADQISDLILDEFLKINNNAKVAIETFVMLEKIIISGEYAGVDFIESDIENKIRNLIKEIGYISGRFNYQDIKIEMYFNHQSDDISRGVVSDSELGAGDQGIMFGYANNETDSYMPAPIVYANTILKNIFKDVKEGKLDKLGPDAKSQVSIIYNSQNQPIGVRSIVLSIQHDDKISLQSLRSLLLPYIKSSFPENWIINDDCVFINPTGRFVIGGPEADCGLTGRKLMVDTYGGYVPHGGGAFSGKDPTKVDRSAAYMARYIAKNIVASGLASNCLIQVSYAIGISDPLSFFIKSDNDILNGINFSEILKLLNLSFSPSSMIKGLNLLRPIYLNTAFNGHFGCNTKDFSWENLKISSDINRIFETIKENNFIFEDN